MIDNDEDDFLSGVPDYEDEQQRDWEDYLSDTPRKFQLKPEWMVRGPDGEYTFESFADPEIIHSEPVPTYIDISDELKDWLDGSGINPSAYKISMDPERGLWIRFDEVAEAVAFRIGWVR